MYFSIGQTIEVRVKNANIMIEPQSTVSRRRKNSSYIPVKPLTAFETAVTPFPVGFYVTVMINSTQTEVAQLLTPEVTSATEMCVRFW